MLFTTMTHINQLSSNQHFETLCSHSKKSVLLTHEGVQTSSFILTALLVRSNSADGNRLRPESQSLMFESHWRPWGPESGGKAMGAAGLRFPMTQFCLHVAWIVLEEKRMTREDMDMWHKRLWEGTGNLCGLQNLVACEWIHTASIPYCLATDLSSINSW